MRCQIGSGKTTGGGLTFRAIFQSCGTRCTGLETWLACFRHSRITATDPSTLNDFPAVIGVVGLNLQR